MFEPANRAETFNQFESNPIPGMVVPNLDSNENESPVNLLDKSGFVDSTSNDRKPGDKTENPHPRERKTSERNVSVKFEEDIIDGFLFQSFDTLEALYAAVEQV